MRQAAPVASHQRSAKATIPEHHAREIELVDELAERLIRHIADSAEVIATLHVHNAQSKAIQNHFASLLKVELNFDEEVVLTSQDGLVTRARPDFFHRFDDSRGILAEVERGGTLTNNHDLKDLWKAHVARDAHHLFLIVPNSNWREDGSSRERPFPRVVRRLSAFFGDERREVDVLSVHVFGY